MITPPTPLKGIRVLEFTHAIMGPSCGVILADLGAEVIKVEPAPDGDYTRRLQSYGSGFFAQFNRNKQSLALDLKTAEGNQVIRKLLQTADVLIENFAPQTMGKLGLGYEQVHELNPQLIYCSLKGFMDGEYENRTALDEPVQMMSGLAYMTGYPGDPLRAGASVIDILSGTYGAVGILAALHEREQTSKGQLIQNGLFETATYLVGQHLAYASTQTERIQPFPGKVRSWAIYRLFTTLDDKQVFIGVTSNKQWEQFCQLFDRVDLLEDTRLADNTARYYASEWLIPDLEAMFAKLTKVDILAKCVEANFPYAPVNQVEDLWDDPHLLGNGTFLPTQMPHHQIVANLPRQPLLFNHDGHMIHLQPPQVGEHTQTILQTLGYDHTTIVDLAIRNIIALSQES